MGENLGLVTKANNYQHWFMFINGFLQIELVLITSTLMKIGLDTF